MAKKLIRKYLAIFFLFSSYSFACGYIPQNLYDWTTYYARGFGLDPDLVASVIWIESRYCPKAVSHAGAIGLGQIIPTTAKSLGVNPEIPVENIYGTAKYLRQQWDTFGDWNLALAAYNAGPGAVRKYNGIPPYKETQHYVYYVLWTYSYIKSSPRWGVQVK